MYTVSDNFEKVKNNLTIETYARAMLTPARAGNKYICPACGSGGNSDRNSDSAFSIKGEKFKCFSCNIHGDVFDLIGICEGLTSRNEQLKAAAKFANITLDYSTTTPAAAATVTTSSNFNPVKIKAPNKTSEQELKQNQLEEQERLKQWQNDINNKDAIAYLNTRGYTLQQAKALKIGYNSNKQALVLPYRGSDYYHVDRCINPASEAKHYKPKTDILGAQPLYNPSALNSDVCIIVEGVFDALALESIGFNDVIALGGCNNQNPLITALKAKAKKPYVVIFLDNDSSGLKAASELKAKLDALKIECKAITGEDLAAANLQGKDPDAMRKYDLDALKSFLSDFLNQCKQEHSEHEEKRYKRLLSAFNIIDNEETLMQLCSSHYEEKRVKTGFNCIDKVLGGGLQTGLTVLGALSSLGKTTLCLQIADYIAYNGAPVLFATIEQSSKELLAKSLSRISYSLQGDSLTGYDVLTRSRKEFNAAKWQSLTAAANQYAAKISPNMFVMEGRKQPTVNDVENAARMIHTQTSKTPVIFIDYLQLLAPINTNTTDKQNTDNNISALRQLARELSTPIMLISSLNRASYNSPITLESFKESGSIEYSSDVLLGLQPANFSDIDTSTKDKQRKDAKEKMQQHKANSERELELVVLKNRNGAIKDGLHLHFSALFNAWKEQQEKNNSIVY